MDIITKQSTRNKKTIRVAHIFVSNNNNNNNNGHLYRAMTVRIDTPGALLNKIEIYFPVRDGSVGGAVVLSPGGMPDLKPRRCTCTL